MHEPKRRKNSGYLLSLNSAWNYNRNYYNCYSYSRFKTIAHLQDYCYYLFYSYYQKVFLSHDNFSSSKTFSRRLQDALDIFKTPQDVPQMSSRRFQDILEAKNYASWKTRNCYAQDVFKASSGHVLKTSSRCLGDHQMFARLILFMNFLSLETVRFSINLLFRQSTIRYLGLASETICIALVLQFLKYLKLWLSVLM